MNGWIGVDLDGTLAHYEGWQGPEHIGPPVPRMVDRVKAWRSEGWTVKIFTARVSTPDEKEAIRVISAIRAWCYQHLGEYLPITNVKDYGMVELWDDRAVQVEQNTGVAVGHSTRNLERDP
jgi:hypothetical protein